MTTMRTLDDMQGTLMEAVQMRGDLTVPALLNVIGRTGVETTGDYQMHFPERPNTVIWTGMSEVAVRAMSTFLGRPDVDLNLLTETGAMIVFGFDGMPVLSLPIGTAAAKDHDFLTPHWIPLTVQRLRSGQRRVVTKQVGKMPGQRVAFTRQDRVAVWNKTHGLCWYCGTRTNPFEDFTIDHVQPVADGGTNDLANLVPCCRTCNSAKRDRPLEVFRLARNGGLFWYEIARGQGQ